MRYIGAWCVLVTAVLWMLTSGCASSEPELPWATDARYGIFQTRDIERAQKEIPFQIIVPSFLPAELHPYPAIMGPLNGQSDSELEVRISYQTVETLDGYIEIYEWNYRRTGGDPRLNPDLAEVQIAGQKVVQREHTFSPVGGYTRVDLPGFIFYWNTDNVYFKAAVYGYDYDTAVRVVESMIQQM